MHPPDRSGSWMWETEDRIKNRDGKNRKNKGIC